MSKYTLVYQITPSSNLNNPFDIIKYNQQYYAGFNLESGFPEYIAGKWKLAVMKFANEAEALNYAKNIIL